LTFLLVVFSSIAHSQWVVKGHVFDKKKKNIPGIPLIVMDLLRGHIVAYGISAKDGSYSISVNRRFVTDSFLIKISAFGYSPQQLIIHVATDQQDFYLTEEKSELPNVIVKAQPKPIRAQGDTINYLVTEFANATDKTIGDVIKKLPDVDVDAQGKITYQGKAINRFYIDGDNLLDDKYNIATNTVRPDMISHIQVLDKHQPIKALENIEFSDAPAMNLITKVEVRTRLVGEGNASLGLPSIYNITANALLLKKKVKFINFLKLNNSGSDLSKEIVSHNFSDYNQQIGYRPLPSLLTSNFSAPPGIGKNRYLFNSSILPGINVLVNTGGHTTLRINTYYLIDKQSQTFDGKTIIYFPGSELKYVENQRLRSSANSLRTQINLNKNDSNYFLNNTFVVETENFSNNAFTQTPLSNPAFVNQMHTGNYTSISNEFSLIRKLRGGRNVLEFFSYLSKNTRPEQLIVTPGLHEMILSGGNPFSGIYQSVALPGSFMSNYVTYRKRIGSASWVSQLGFSYQLQRAEDC
jgi:hypothetical protein